MRHRAAARKGDAPPFRRLNAELYARISSEHADLGCVIDDTLALEPAAAGRVLHLVAECSRWRGVSARSAVPGEHYQFTPARGNPFVCDECGYAEHVELKHGGLEELKGAT